jgi:preprotein translocase subunit SecG
MHTLVIIIHLIACFLMIGAILLQSGKGAEIGAAFGGSSQTVFGSRGPANFLSKFTVVVAVVFMVTSLSLAILAKERTFSSTVIDLKNKDAAPTAPVTPAAPTDKPASDSHSSSDPSAAH